MFFTPSPIATSRIIESPLNPRSREGTPDSDRYFWTIGKSFWVAIWTVVSIVSLIAVASMLIDVLA